MYFHPFSRKDSAGRKGEPVTKAQSSQKQNSADENLQDIFSSSCNITRLSPSGKDPKSVPATIPVVAVARNKKTDKQ
jgi:hypothetical protein